MLGNENKVNDQQRLKFRDVETNSPKYNYTKIKEKSQENLHIDTGTQTAIIREKGI